MRAFLCFAGVGICISRCQSQLKLESSKRSFLMKRYSILFVILCASTFAMAQKADAAFVVGGSFVSDTTEIVALPPGFSGGTTIKTDHHIFLEGALGVRLLNAH